MSDDEGSNSIHFDYAYVKFDLFSDEKYVELIVRITTKEHQDKEEIEDGDEFAFKRAKGEISETDIMACMEVIMDAEIPMPEEYFDNIRTIINIMIKDKTNYSQDDIRLLWDMFPDNEPPAVSPRILTGELKKAIDEFVKLPGISYR